MYKYVLGNTLIHVTNRCSMGRIKNIAIKTLGKELIEEHGDKFSEDFEQNKKILETMKQIKSKKVRNTLVGYISKEMKRIKKSGI